MDQGSKEAPNSPAAVTPPSAPPPAEYDIADPMMGEVPPPAPVVAAAPPTPPQPIHPADLVKLAERMGFSKEDLAGMSSEQARVMVNKVAYRLIPEGRSAEAAANHPEVTAPDPAAAGAVRASERAAPPSSDDLLPEDGEEYDATLAKKFNAQTKRIAALEAKLAELGGITQQLHSVESGRQARAIDRLIDEAFGSLGDEYKGTLGTGSMRDLSDAAAKARRNAIVGEARRLAGKEASPQALASKIAEATRLLYPTAPVAPTPAPGAAATNAPIPVEKWNAGATEPPTQRKPGPEPKGLDAAKKEFMSRKRELDEREMAGATSVNGTDEL